MPELPGLAWHPSRGSVFGGVDWTDYLIEPLTRYLPKFVLNGEPRITTIEEDAISSLRAD
jgi:hypothetical protein